MSVQYWKSKIVVLVILSLALASCIGGEVQETPAFSDAEYTEAAETLVAEMTLNAPTATVSVPTQDSAALAPSLTPTDTLPPTSTPLPTDTPLPTATAAPTNTPLPPNTPTFTYTPEPTWKLFFADDFNHGYSGWYFESDNTVHYNFTQSGFAIRNLVDFAVVTSLRTKRDFLQIDTRIEVNGVQLMGKKDGYYGVICRSTDLINYYLFAVGTDGWYGIGIMRFGTLRFLAEGIDTTAIYSGYYVNHIQADCVGTKLTLYANGNKMAEVQDSNFSAGAFGLAVGTRKNPEYEALFDDFKVYIPE